MEKAEVMELINAAIEKSERVILDKCNNLYVRQSSCVERHEHTDNKINSIDTKIEVIGVDVKNHKNFLRVIETTIITGFLGLIFAAMHFMN